MKTVILASLLLAVTLINARQNIQQHRIFKGVQQGDLTFRESQKLQRGQDHVQHLEDKAKANGFVSPLERARIHTAQNIQSARIFLKRHN
jgi:hypothetical protein